MVSMAVGNVRIGKGEEGDRITGKGSYVGSLFLKQRWRIGGSGECLSCLSARGHVFQGE